jgi:hypothetical protein
VGIAKFLVVALLGALLAPLGAAAALLKATGAELRARYRPHRAP